MRIAAYCRVSSDRAEQLDSLGNQETFFQSYARRSGHTLVAIYADEGISGRALKHRDAFLRMLADAEHRVFDMIVVKDISRFARNTVDALTAVRQLKRWGIEVTFLSNSMTVLGQSEFVLTIFSALAQEESAGLSKRVKFGKRVTAEKGRVPNVVYGYDHVDALHLSVNPAEAETVRRIFTSYVREGWGCRKIAEDLNSRGIPTKKGAVWDSRGVHRILENSLYCGEYVNRKYEVTDFLEGRLVPTDPSERLTHHRPEWAIVSPDLFDAARCQRVERRSGLGRYSARHRFSGLIRCAVCGGTFVRRSYTYARTRVYWACPGRGGCSNGVTVTEADLQGAITSHLTEAVGGEDAFAARMTAAGIPWTAADARRFLSLEPLGHAALCRLVAGVVVEPEGCVTVQFARCDTPK